MRMYPTANCPLRKSRCHIHHVYLTASARTHPAPRLSNLIHNLQRVATPEFRRHHDLLHQSVLSILSVWRTPPVYQTTCLCSIGFLNRLDKSLDTAFRNQGQRLVHLYAALQVCVAQRFHSCQGDRIPLHFALVHQRVSNRTDEAHVGAEAKVLILCIVSIERRWLAQASQVFEQVCIKRLRHSRDSVASTWISGSNEQALLPCMKKR